MSPFLNVNKYCCCLLDFGVKIFSSINSFSWLWTASGDRIWPKKWVWKKIAIFSHTSCETLGRVCGQVTGVGASVGAGVVGASVGVGVVGA